MSVQPVDFVGIRTARRAMVEGEIVFLRKVAQTKLTVAGPWGSKKLDGETVRSCDQTSRAGDAPQA